MTYLIAGLVAAGIAWLGNIFIVRYWGDQGVIWAVPGFEEIIKTSAALLLGASVPLTHGVFGLTEAVHDFIFSRRLGFWAGLASVISHWLFGQATYLVFKLTGFWAFGIILSTVLHICLNFLMMLLFSYLSRF